MQILPLPHRYDRYRLIALILDHQHQRISPHLSQIHLEEITKIDQSTISRILSPNFLGEKGKRNLKLNRGHLLALTRLGLQLDHYRASLILWLSEGEEFVPWRLKELESAKLPLPDLQEQRLINAFRDDPYRAHSECVELVQEMCIRSTELGSWYAVETELLHGRLPIHHLALYEKLTEMEATAGQRMLVSKYPSMLIATDLGKSSGGVKESPQSIQSQLKIMLTERQRLFQQNLAKYGERAIHSVPSLKRFVSAKFNHHLSLEERKDRIQGLITLLDGYPRFQVGLLIDVEPEVEIAIKSTSEAVIRGTARELSNHPETASCGPSFLHWTSQRAILNFYVDFERLWIKLNLEGLTNKKMVLIELGKLLRS